MEEFYLDYATNDLLVSYYKEELRNIIARIEKEGHKNNETKLQIFKKCVNATMELNKKIFK